MSIYARVARKTRMNTLRMARSSKRKSITTRKIEQKIKEAKRSVVINKPRGLVPQKSAYVHEDFRLSQYDRKGTVATRQGGDPQTDWMRWRQPENAVLNLLSPEARAQTLGAGLNVNIVGRAEQAQYNPFSKTVDIRSGMKADEIRHELTHAGLALTPNLFPDVGIKYKFASSPLGGALGALNTRLFTKQAKQYWTESAAVTMGGQEAYPGYKPAFVPEQFSNFFNTQDASWQYLTRPGWNIGE